MSAYEAQMRTRSKGTWNISQSLFTKSSAISFKLSEINTYGNKLKLKDDNFSAFCLKIQMVFLQSWDIVLLRENVNNPDEFSIGFK